ncbi:DUF2946 family protein [Rhizobium sp. KVB221]|uniref:DUF2946 family protein n=1 Tax=Rhizobium setariae TaxID=2801340 RepID=A0A936YS84_9HYPH|nr:DUF2946 family protein [Rhizobium setariae]MBL0373847.1 DUF2946 family protein [Rhizobium setariae]
MATRIICVIALFMLGFAAHADTRAAIGPYGAEYMLPDGSYASMCLPSEEHGGAPHSDGNHCDVCVFATIHLFTPPAFAVLANRAAQPVEKINRDSNPNLKRITSFHQLSRGPPLKA